MLEAEGVHRQHVGALGLQTGDEGVDGQQVTAHPVCSVEEDAYGRPFRMETLGDVGVDVRSVAALRMVDAFPGQWRGRLVAMRGPEIRVAQEQEQILEVLDTALHQVGEDSVDLGHRCGAGRDQVFVPFLVTGARDERNAFAAAVPDQRIEAVGHGPLAAQQP